ncbi:MAG: hypothetical protein U0269_16925 [Polyangiales bacterium]
MSERRDPTTDKTHDTDAERDESTAFTPSLRAALVEWERSFVPALPSDFADEVMLELSAQERAAEWERSFVPALPEDFASTVASAAMAAEHNRSLMSAWAESVPALPEDFAQSVTDAALADEAAREQGARVAMREWAEAKVPALPADFAQSVAEMALRAEESPRTSGVVEKVVPLAPKGAAKRRWLAPAAFSSIAAAAVAVLALTAGPRPRTQPNGQHGAHTNPPSLHNANNGSQTSGTPSNTANNAAASNTGATTNAATNAAPEDGSEVEKVEVDGDRASFTAFSIAGEDDHGAVAVVWIEDGTKTSSAQ